MPPSSPSWSRPIRTARRRPWTTSWSRRTPPTWRRSPPSRTWWGDRSRSTDSSRLPSTMTSMTTTTARLERLHFTGDDESDRLLASDPLALLIGFALDQQVSVQKAFSGPAELRRRIGHLDSARIAAMDPAELERVFRERPALHRFPGAMARRVQTLCAAI